MTFDSTIVGYLQYRTPEKLDAAKRCLRAGEWIDEKDQWQPEGEVLTTELTIQGGAEPGERTPSDELMDLDRSRSPTELAVIGGLLIASLIAGVVLIRQE